MGRKGRRRASKKHKSTSEQALPPYGTPPYVALYPHGGFYPYPSIWPGSLPYGSYHIQPPNGTLEASVSGARGRKPRKSKKRKGSFDGITSQSDDSGSDGSSEGSSTDSDNIHGSQTNDDPDYRPGKKTKKQIDARSPSTETKQVVPTPVMLNPGVPFWAIPPPGVAGPTTPMNSGMQYWGVSPTAISVSGKVPAAMSVATPQGVVVPYPTILDERELKRQRRKQSNREAARRSRLRKQVEWEEVAKNAVVLKEENNAMKEELKHLKEECDKMTLENASMTVKIVELESGTSRPGDVDWKL